MPALETKQIPLGFTAPDFTLLDTISGEMKSLDELKSDKATLIMFVCNHCPFVVHVWDELMRLADDYMTKGIKLIAISSNDVENYPDDHPDKMKELAQKTQMPFPYLYDETQKTAKDYQAVCTPDFSIFDGDMTCVYRGQLDDSRPSNGKPLNGKDIRAALDAILEGKPVSEDQKPSIGCSIKWK